MTRFLNHFRHDEDGAVSVDWVVLTAAMVIFAALIATTVKTGAETGGQNIEAKIVGMVTP